MGKRRSEDPIEELVEWEEHQLNPGYWVNRYNPFFPPKRTPRMWILALIDLALVGSAAILLWLNSFLENSLTLDLLLTLLLPMSLLAIAATLRAIRLRPERREPPQELVEKWNRERNEEERDQPKRRKDYR